MNDFNRCNKVTGVHWLKKPVENLQIKITIKPKDGILCLPKFEDYANETDTANLQSDSKTEYSFKWQEKVFSSWELQRYSNVHNCLTDTELSYHETLENSDCKHSNVFSYIHEDYHFPLPAREFKKNKSNNSNVQNWNLSSCFQSLNLNDSLGVVLGHDSSSRSRLFRSQEDIAEEEEHWTAMHIMFDNSEYTEDSQLLVKQECILLSLYHNKTHNYILVTPDVTNLDLNPYTIDTDTGMALGYHYSIEIGFENESCSEELVDLLKKLYKKWERKHREVLQFATPPIGFNQYYVALEILSARNFEMDHLYVEFHIKIPEGVKCRDAARGRTHVAKTLTRDKIECAHFGHLVELHLEVKAGTEPPPLQIFFEVISTDWWGRHRTEGYTHLAISLRPGRYDKTLSCSRPEELNAVVASERRFFVGGCHLIEDLEVLAKPQLANANFKFVASGELTLRWNTISQTSIPSAIQTPSSRASSSAALLRGAEAALRQYKRARARLAIATEGLSDASGLREGKDGAGDG